MRDAFRVWSVGAVALALCLVGCGDDDGAAGGTAGAGGSAGAAGALMDEYVLSDQETRSGERELRPNR